MARIFLILWTLIAGATAGSYVITAPQVIQPGSVYHVNVDILNTTSDVKVEVSIQDQRYNGETGKYELKSLLNATGIFRRGITEKLTLPIMKDFHCDSCRVNIRGSGGLQFEKVLHVVVSQQVAVILVQTDKAIYKPTQTVRFRTLAVYPDLKLYDGLFHIEILDPNTNKIKVLSNVSDTSGVVEGYLNLSDQPVFGTWTISVSLVNVRESYKQTFEVAQYELPRFEVKVVLPPYALTTDDILSGTVEVKYTFGQPVKGFVEVHVGPNYGPNSCGQPPKTTQIGFEIDGQATFSIPKEDIQKAVRISNLQEVKVTAFVKEDATGVRLNGSSVVTWYDNKYQVRFTDNTPSVFKPGLPYTAFIQVTTPDNKPPTEKNITVSVYTTVTYEMSVDDQKFYDRLQFSGTYGLPGKNVTLPASGLLPIDVVIPLNATRITVKASVQKVQTTMTIEKMISQSNNFIQLSLLNKNIKSGSRVLVRVEGTEPLNNLTVEVLSRGSVAYSGTVLGFGKKSFTFDLLVTPEMAPTAHLLTYYARGTDEVVADSLAFNIDGIFENEVAISFSKNESEPNLNLDVNVKADPLSKVYILAVDQSVLLLKTGNDITSDNVNTAVLKFDREQKPKDSEFALSYSSRDVSDVFSQTGISVITDITLASTMYTPSPPSFVSSVRPTVEFDVASDARAPIQVKDVEHVRQLFPEAWLWTAETTGADGTASVSTLVPDTITSWVASAFATNPVSGLGVAPTTAILKVFRPFFVSLTVPSVVTQGEQLVIQATVFNYLPGSAQVTVTLRGSRSFQSVKIAANGLESLESSDQVQIFNVAPEEQGVAYFPILASEIGVIDIEILAQSTVASDGVRRQIMVQPEGAPVSYNYPIFVNLENNGNFKDSFDFPLPASLVNGSDRIRLKVTGDLIGSSLDNLATLLQLPTGCGEQSMVSFAPDLYIADYLQATGQETEAVRHQILDLLEAGYQRQLTYQRQDGGFSAFGNFDESGSTWLTAYVSRVLGEAQDYIFVDTQVLVKAVDWIVGRQNKDGSFNEFGKVLDRSMQGTGTGPALTAFVLLSLLQNRPLASSKCSEKSECPRVYQWGNATENATKNLEALVDSDAIHDQFSLAVVSYALTLAKSNKAGVAFAKLGKTAKSEGGLLYWSDNVTVSTRDSSQYLIWHPPRIQAMPIDILVTSYAILTYAVQNRLAEALPAVRWLTAQRNSLGGFASSQDTSVALQALSAYAAKSVRSNTNLDIQFSNPSPLANFHVDKTNALALQIKEVKNAPQVFNIDVTGSGFALVEVDVDFNTDKEISTSSFDVSTVLLDDEIDSFNLMVCTKWLWDRETGMVVQVISIPSGFQPDLDSLSSVAGLKRSERRGNTLNIYFDKISKSSVCYSVRMTRSEKIARSQQNYVTTYDYYSPRDQSTVFWRPKKPSVATICDVCKGCCT